MDERIPNEDETTSRHLSHRLFRVLRDWGLSILAVALIFHFLGQWRAPDLPVAAPEFVLSDLDGNPVALSSFHGRPVVLNFWATWCGPCRMEVPSFSDFAEANPEIPVLGVAVDGSTSELRATSEAWGMTYPVLLASEEVKEAYGVSTLPTTVIIDPEGRVHSAHSGIMFRPQLEWELRNW